MLCLKILMDFFTLLERENRIIDQKKIPIHMVFLTVTLIMAYTACFITQASQFNFPEKAW